MFQASSLGLGVIPFTLTSSFMQVKHDVTFDCSFEKKQEGDTCFIFVTSLFIIISIDNCYNESCMQQHVLRLNNNRHHSTDLSQPANIPLLIIQVLDKQRRIYLLTEVFVMD